MSSATEGALPEPVRGVRATDADRTRVVARLRAAAGEGAIDLDELEQRIATVYEARSVAELSRVTADLPVSLAAPGARPPEHRTPLALEDDEFRGHLTTYSLVIGMLVVIWLATGLGHPWPIYPALGWGIGLGSHYQVAATHQRKRLARATAEGLTLDQLEQRERDEKRDRRRPRHQDGPRPIERARERRHERHERWQERRRPTDRLDDRGRDAPADEPVTRFVVAMFVDVVGSTSLNEALGDQQWASVRRAFRDLVTEALGAHGGWEVSTSGDGVLARFEEPARAADAAVAVLRRLERQRADTGFAPSVRVGIHSGDAVEEGDDIIGNVVNTACRVSEAADRDEILVTEHVADHLDGRHATRGTGLHTLKGIGRPRHLLALDWR